MPCFHTMLRSVELLLAAASVLAVEPDHHIARKWKKASALGREGKWVFEIGDTAAAVAGSSGGGGGGTMMISSSSNPQFVNAADSAGAWTWRVRNAPWPL